MDDFEIRDRIYEILNDKIAMGAGDDDNLYQDGGYRPRRRKAVGGRLRKFPSGEVGDAASGIKYFDFVKEWRDANPGYSWAQAVELASEPYHQLKAAGVLVGGESDGYLFDGIGGEEDDDFYEGGYGTSRGAKKGWATRRKNLRSKSKMSRKSGSKRISMKRVKRKPRKANSFVECLQALRDRDLPADMKTASRDNYCKLNKKCYRTATIKKRLCKKPVQARSRGSKISKKKR